MPIKFKHGYPIAIYYYASLLTNQSKMETITVFEENSKLNIKTSHSNLSKILVNFIPLHHLDNIPSKIKQWTSIGIISSGKISSHSKKDIHISEYNLTDLKGNNYHLLVEDQALKDEKLQVKDVIMLSTAKIVYNVLSEDLQNSPETFAIHIENKNMIQKIGQSVDFEFCKYFKGEKKCNVPVNKTSSTLCPFHFSLETKRIRSSRSELSGSVGLLRPVQEKKNEDKEIEFKIKGQNFSLNKSTKKKTSYYDTAKKNTKVIDHISKVNTPGSRYLKEQKKTETENWIKGILAKETKDYKNLERRVESVMKNVDMPVLGREIQKGSTFQLELTDDEEE